MDNEGTEAVWCCIVLLSLPLQKALLWKLFNDSNYSITYILYVPCVQQCSISNTDKPWHFLCDLPCKKKGPYYKTAYTFVYSSYILWKKASLKYMYFLMEISPLINVHFLVFTNKLLQFEFIIIAYALFNNVFFNMLLYSFFPFYLLKISCSEHLFEPQTQSNSSSGIYCYFKLHLGDSKCTWFCFAEFVMQFINRLYVSVASRMLM